jgi:predicted DNA repair protein MutK
MDTELIKEPLTLGFSASHKVKNSRENRVEFIQNDNKLERLQSSSLEKRKIKAKINTQYTLTDEQLSAKLSDNVEEYQLPSYTEDDYKALINSHRPIFYNGLEKWL